MQSLSCALNRLMFSREMKWSICTRFADLRLACFAKNGGRHACPDLLMTRLADWLGLCRPGFGSIGHGVEHGEPGLLNRGNCVIYRNGCA